MTIATKGRGMVDAGAELARLAELEQVIERGLQSFVEVGNAIIAIQIGKLYKVAGFDTFDGYMRDRWQIGRARGYQLMTAAATHKAIADALPEMSTAVDISPPSTERQTRSLAGLDPKVAAELWAELTVAFGQLDTTGPAVEAARILVDAGLDPNNAACCVYGWTSRRLNVVDEARERAALPNPLGCSVCARDLGGCWDGDDRCTECIEAFRFPLSEIAAPAVVTPPPVEQPAGDGDTAVASPATIAATTPTGGGPAVGEELPPAPSPTATPDVVTPDAVIAPPKPSKPRDKSHTEYFEDDYVRHLKRLAAASKSWAYLRDIDKVTSGSRGRILARLTEDEQQALFSLANATGIGDLS